MVDKVTPEDSVIVAASEEDSVLLYYCHRKGWAFSLDREAMERENRENEKRGYPKDPLNFPLDPILRLENLRQKGATHFVTANMNLFNEEKEFSTYMFSKYDVLKYEKDRYIIFMMN